MADVVHLPGAHAGQVHVDEGLLDTLLASPVSFDDRGLEDRALEFGHLQREPAGLGGQAPVVVAGPVRLPLPGALVLGGVGDLVGLKRRASRSIARRPFRRPSGRAWSRAGSGRSV